MRCRNFKSTAVSKLLVVILLLGLTLQVLSRAADAQVGLKTYTGIFDDRATYLIEVPRDWNKTLIIFSNGYTFPGFPNPPADTDDLRTRLYLLSHGYALAGSAYATEGWAVEDGMRDQILVLDKFKSLIGPPKRTIAWGGSMGGEITAGLLQNHPERFTGGVSVCGVLSGTVGLWNQWLDSAFALNVLLASGNLEIAHITDPWGDTDKAEQVLFDAQITPQGQARIALIAALIDSPGWIDPFSPEPDPTDYATREMNQFLSLTGAPFFFFLARAELEVRAGGNPSWNTGVDYHKQLQRSINYAEVQALYQQAGLNLDADLDVLNHSSRVAADPAALNYANQNISFNGELKVTFLTMHTTGDDLVNVQVEQAYRAVVREKHNALFLRQTFVHRAGHCNFTSAESIAAIQTLIHRLDTGQWQGVDPDTLNTAAGALPPVYNALWIGAPVMEPAFVDYTPAKFLRRFDAP